MKYVVVSGGVVSGLGKGVTASSIGLILKSCGFRVTAIKIGLSLFLSQQFFHVKRTCHLLVLSRKVRFFSFLHFFFFLLLIIFLTAKLRKEKKSFRFDFLAPTNMKRELIFLYLLTRAYKVKKKNLEYSKILIFSTFTVINPC